MNVNEKGTPARTEPVPQGAIWIKNFKIRKAISDYLSSRDLECPSCHSHFNDKLTELQEADLYEKLTNQTYIIKLKTVREKFIAFHNPKKTLSTHPDAFMFVYEYQSHTGAPAVYPFSSSRTESTQGPGYNPDTGQGQTQSYSSSESVQNNRTDRHTSEGFQD